MMAKYNNAYVMTMAGMTTTTTTTHLDQLTQPPRLGARGSPTTTADAEERSIAHGASHSESTSLRTPGSSRESSPATGTNTRCNIPTDGGTGLPTRFPYLPHQPHQLSSSLQQVRGGTCGQGASD